MCRIVEPDETQHLLGNPEDRRMKEESWKYIGYVCGVLNVAAFTAATGTAQAFGKALPMFEMGVVRFSFLLLVSSLMIVLGGLEFRIKWSSVPFVMGLAMTQISYTATLYGALQYLPVTTVTCLKQVISVVVGFAVTHMATRVLNISRGISIALCVVGTILLVQPPAIFHSFLPTEPQSLTKPVCFPENFESVETMENVTQLYTMSPLPAKLTVPTENPENATKPRSIQTEETPHLYYGYVLGCICPVLSAAMWFIINKGLSDLNPFVINFWISLICEIVLSIMTGLFNTLIFPTGTKCISLLFAHGLAFSLNVTFSVIVNQNFELLMCALLSTLELTGVLCAQYTVLDKINPGHKNGLEIVGALVVILGNTTGPVFELYKEAKGKDEQDSKPETLEMKNHASK